jgi:hypothetical protein
LQVNVDLAPCLGFRERSPHDFEIRNARVSGAALKKSLVGTNRAGRNRIEPNAIL